MRRYVLEFIAMIFTLVMAGIILYNTYVSDLNINEKILYSLASIPLALMVFALTYFVAPRLAHYAIRLVGYYKYAPIRLGVLRVHNLGALVVAIVSHASTLILLVAHHVIPAIVLMVQGLIFTYMAFFKKSYVKLEVAKKIKTPWYIWLPRLHSRLMEYSVKISSKFKGLIEESGVILPSIYLGCLVVSLAILSIPLTITLVALTGLPGLIILILPVLPILYLYLRKKTRYESAVKQLPFFAYTVELFHMAGCNMVHVFEEGLAPVKEVLVYKRLRSLYGLDPFTALRKLAKQHHNEFGDYINGYVDVALSGGDLQAYVSDKAREYLNRLSYDWITYAGEAGGIAETLFIVFVLGPILILSSSLLGGQGFFAIYNYMVLILGALALLIVSALTPKYALYVDDSKAVKIGLIAATVALAASYIFNMDTWVKLGLVIAAFLACYGFTVRIQLYEAWEEEHRLPYLLRRILEYIRTGYPIDKALEESKDIAVFRDKITLYLRTSSLPRFKSSISGYVFGLIDVAKRLGATTPETLQKILYFAETVLEAKRRSSKMLLRYEILAFISPIVLTIFPWIIVAILSKFSSLATPLGFATGPGIDENQLNTSIILSTTVLAILLAKTKSLTIRDTVKPLFILVITILSLLYLKPVVMSWW